MNRSLWNKRIPTILGFILLGVGLFSLNWLINSGALFLTKAAPEYAPEDIRITNLSDTSFTVSYVTKEPVIGTLSYGENTSLGKVAFDDRDQQSGTPQPYITHHITVRNLSPNTKYYFTITSADKTFLDKDMPFIVQTLSPLSDNPPPQPPIVGKVVYPDGTSDNNILIFLVSENAQVISTLTKKDGTFVLPLNAIRTKDYTSYLQLKDDSVIKLLVKSSNYESRVSLLASQINPVPQITLSNTYDFTTSFEPLSDNLSSESASQTIKESFPSFTATEALPTEPRILVPKNQEAFSDQQPKFEGTAPPGSEVEIEINSQTAIKTTIKADTRGVWSFRPQQKLAPGEHTITIKTKDENGILRIIKRSFTVYAQGSQFTEPSVSPQEPTPTPTNTPTPTPTQQPTPTNTPLPTVESTPASITPTIDLSPTPTLPPPQESPGSSLMVFSGIITTLMAGIGLLLFVLSRGKASL